VPNEFKLFIWLVALDRGLCTLCDQEIESIDHLLVQCVYSQELWFFILRRCGWMHLTLSDDDSFIAWWLRSRKLVVKARRPAFDSIAFLTVRQIWLQCNDRVFRSAGRQVVALADLIWQQAGLWSRAGLIVGPQLRGE
jgi:hypothetical protein